MIAPRVAFRATGELAARLTDARLSMGDMTRRDLTRYYALLAAELADLELTEGEALVIVDSCNGAYWDPWSIQLLPAAVAKAIDRDRLDQKWLVDGPALLTKLQRLTRAQCYAVTEAAARFWREQALKPTPFLDKLREVGLVKREKAMV